jgi:DNA-binding protein H-NS
MAKHNLGSMNVEALLNLRGEVDQELESRRDLLQTQLQSLGMGSVRGGGGKSGRRSVMLGRKVPAKYRSPEGDTWAGRGAKPRWLVAATAKGTGKKLDDFLIEKTRKRKAAAAEAE